MLSVSKPSALTQALVAESVPTEETPAAPGQRAAPLPGDRFGELDRDGSGTLSRDELVRPELFEQMDGNGDGAITREESRTFFYTHRDWRGWAPGEDGSRPQFQMGGRPGVPRPAYRPGRGPRGAFQAPPGRGWASRPPGPWRARGALGDPL